VFWHINFKGNILIFMFVYFAVWYCRCEWDFQRFGYHGSRTRRNHRYV